MHMPFALDVSTAAERIRALEPRVRAYVSTRLDDAVREREGAAADGPLAGVPFGLKDEWETLVLPTTGGSHRHRARTSPVDSQVYRVFREAGAVLVGKTNLSDMGVAPEASNFLVGSTTNPFDRRRTAGGSSGGAAAAVANGMQGFDWGTDIGGSIRMPAAFCGVLGLKLSAQTWPMSEMFPTVPPALESLCGMGPFTQTIDQMRAVLAAARPLRTGLARPFEPRGAAIYAPVAGRWPRFAAELEPHLRAAIGPVERALLPGPVANTQAYLSLWCSHFEQLIAADPSLDLRSGSLATLSAVFLRGRFGDRRMHPTSAELFLLMAILRMAGLRDRQRARARAHRIRSAFESIWDRGMVVVSPVCVYPPPRIGRTNYNPRLLSYTLPGNLADATGLSIPFGRFGELPRSIQILGPPGSEDALLDMGERLIASRDGDPAQRPVQLPVQT